MQPTLWNRMPTVLAAYLFAFVAGAASVYLWSSRTVTRTPPGIAGAEAAQYSVTRLGDTSAVLLDARDGRCWWINLGKLSLMGGPARPFPVRMEGESEDAHWQRVGQQLTQEGIFTAGPTTLGELASGEEGYRDAKARGADETTAWAIFALNAGVGDPAMGLGSVPKILAEANFTTKGMLMRALANAGAVSSQTFASDAIASALYTDERRMNVQRLLEQGALGGLSSIFREGLHKAYEKVNAPPKPKDLPAAEEKH